MSWIKIKSKYKDLDKYDSYGTIYYYKKNTKMFHNPYGPAIISDARKDYWIEDKLHRLDGPARIWKNGRKEHYINNKYLTKEEFEVHPERLKYLDKEYLICLL